MSNAAPIYPLPSQVGTPKSGLLRLRDSVAEYFDYWSIPAIVAKVGLKFREFKLNQAPNGGNRVVFIPGDFDGSGAPKPRKYGEINRNSRNHASVCNPRELANWDRAFTLSVWSAPVPGQGDDEGASIGVCEDLLEQVIRAVQAAGRADIVWGEVTIQSPPQDNAFGAELLVKAIQHGPIFDKTLEYVQPTLVTDVEMTP